MSLGACNVKEARGHLRGWAPKCSRVWSASPSRRDWAEPVLVLYGPGALCTIELRSTSHTPKTSRPATDLGCCHGLEKQHRLQDFHIRGMATRPLLLSSLYQVHINVLDKIFQITGRIHNECRHQKGIQRLATLQYSSHFIYLYTATAFRPRLVKYRWTHCPHVCCQIYIDSRGMCPLLVLTQRYLSVALEAAMNTEGLDHTYLEV